MSLVRFVSVALALAATLIAVPAAQAAKLPAGAGTGAVAPISNEGRWFVDATGRVAQLRGVNEVYKTAPYYPAADGFGNDDVELLKKLGLNVVRLGVDLRGLMPTPGKVETDYILEPGARWITCRVAAPLCGACPSTSSPSSNAGSSAAADSRARQTLAWSKSATA